MNGIVHETVRLRVDSRGFHPPGEDWMRCSGVRALPAESERALLRAEVIREGSCRKESEWKALMVSERFEARWFS